MKSTKQITLGTIVALITLFGMIYGSSCQKDNCKAVTCLNNTKCSAGMCQCPTGMSGANCETIYSHQYMGRYKGPSPSGNTDDSLNSLAFDTVKVDTAKPNYNNMTVTWRDSTNVIVTLPILLAGNSVGGSTFTINDTTISSVRYTGGGTISTTNATMHVKEEFPAVGGVVPVTDLTFNNYYRY